MSVKDLESLCTTIETMRVFHQKEILKILSSHKDKLTLNENKNGVLVNLTDVSENIIKEIENYISHVETQEKELDDDESKKTNLKNKYFNG